MEKIGRNDPCPCGSGKKYKKCCEQKKVVAIDQILDQEVKEWQDRLLTFAYTEFEHEIDSIVEQWSSDLPNDEELLDFINFHTINWAIFCEEMDDGKTIFEKFLEKYESTIQRPSLRETIRKWTDFKLTVAEIITVTENQSSLIIENIFNDEQIEIKLIQDEQDEFMEGQIVAGIVLPYRDTHTFFTICVEIQPELTDETIDEMLDFYDESEYEDENEYVKANYPMILQRMIMVDSMETMLETLEWFNEKQENVAHTFQEVMLEVGYPKEVVQTTILLWYKYCHVKSPKIQNENVYVATLHYMVSMLFDAFFHITQKELADIYGVSSSTISQRYRELQSVLDKELSELERELEHADFFDPTFDFEDDNIFYEDDDFDFDDEDEVDFNEFPMPFQQSPFLMERELLKMQREMEGHEFAGIDEVNEFLNKRINKPVSVVQKLSARDQAQELLFDAYEEEGAKRHQLVKKALKLYPNSVDAYNILGDEAATIEEAENYYKKAIEAGEKDLGKDYIEENKGHFWMDVKTRPYMRAKQNYAYVLWEMGKKDEAIAAYKEMLELNPNDNQGIRYEILRIFLETGEYEEADKLIQAYGDEGSANFQYNKVLLEYKKNGLTKRLKLLWRNAVTTNPFVPDYIIRKKTFPVEPLAYMGIGDETEAINYAQQHAALWWREKELVDWAKKEK